MSSVYPFRIFFMNAVYFFVINTSWVYSFSMEMDPVSRIAPSASSSSTATTPPTSTKRILLHSDIRPKPKAKHTARDERQRRENMLALGLENEVYLESLRRGPFDCCSWVDYQRGGEESGGDQLRPQKAAAEGVGENPQDSQSSQEAPASGEGPVVVESSPEEAFREEHFMSKNPNPQDLGSLDEDSEDLEVEEQEGSEKCSKKRQTVRKALIDSSPIAKRTRGQCRAREERDKQRDVHKMERMGGAASGAATDSCAQTSSGNSVPKKRRLVLRWKAGLLG